MQLAEVSNLDDRGPITEEPATERRVTGDRRLTNAELTVGLGHRFPTSVL